MRVVICEDDAVYRDSIRKKVEQWSQQKGYVVTVHLFSSSEDLLEAWEQGQNFNLMFLDILFDYEMNGMQLAKRIREHDDQMPIVFITNSDAYIRDGYMVSALRYLNKPVTYDDISECMDIAFHRMTLSQQEYLVLNTNGGRHAIRIREIKYIEAIYPQIRIVTSNSNQPLCIRYHFRDLITQLSQTPFIQCHRSYLVNILFIRSVQRTELFLAEGERLPVSRLYVDEVYKAFDRFYQEGGQYLCGLHLK